MSMSKKLPQFLGGTLFLSTDFIAKLIFLSPESFSLSETQCENLSAIEGNMPYVAGACYVFAFMLLCLQHYCRTRDKCCRSSKNTAVAPQPDTALISSRDELVRKSSKQQLVVNERAWVIQLISTEIILFSADQILKTFIPSMVSGILLALYVFHFFYKNIFEDERYCARCKRDR